MRDLMALAREVRRAAYAPYSRYLVGSAVLGEDGKIYVGCNVESASYGLTICAERNAIFRMVAEGCRAWVAIAVVTEDGSTPCGACLQVLSEFAEAGNCPIITLNAHGRKRIYTLKALIPKSFRRAADKI